MRRIGTYLVNYHQDVFRYLIIILSVLLITYLIPKTESFKYEFSEGKPWKYEDLIAPIDFAVLKDEEQLEREKQEVVEEFIPWYVRDNDVVERETAQFIQLFADNWNDSAKHGYGDFDSLYNINTGLNLLKEIYQKGIIQPGIEKAHPAGKTVHQIRIIDGNTAEIVDVDELLTLRGASMYISRKLRNDPGVDTLYLLPLLVSSLNYNIIYDDSLNRQFLQQALDKISPVQGLIQEGELIITRGAIVTKEKFRILESFKQAYQDQVIGSGKSYLIFLGYLILIGLLFSLWTVFLKNYAAEAFYNFRSLLFLILLVVLFVSLERGLVSSDLEFYYAIPFCIVPIIIRTIYGNRLALNTYVLLLLITGLIIPYGFKYILLQFIAGMTAVFNNRRTLYWSQFFTSNAYILLVYLLGYTGLSLIETGDFKEIELINYGWLGINVLLTLLAYPLIPMFERVFGFVSSITLLELADINKPLLKELSLKAPGTFQHSLQVANLAEAAVAEIGGNSLLAKVGALYHDIGKMENPEYFIENQIPGINPHDQLSLEESARIIIGHVKKGVELAKKHNLPDIIIDFIRTHHGTSRVEYFYKNYIKNFPDRTVDERLFRYPGPLPYSKETAVVMMADTVEAASRSLTNPTDKDIDELVENLINYKIEQGQFVNADITFKDITVVKKKLKTMLHSIYHVRIAYPEDPSKNSPSR